MFATEWLCSLGVAKLCPVELLEDDDMEDLLEEYSLLHSIMMLPEATKNNKKVRSRKKMKNASKEKTCSF